MADPELQNLLLSNEQLYRPQYANINLQEANQYLTGTGTQGQAGYVPGLLAQAGTASEAMSGIQSTANTAQRTSDIADVANLGASASAAFRAANPEMYAQLAKAQALGAPSDYFGGLQQAIGNQQQFGQIQFDPAQAAAAARVQGVRGQNVGMGALGGQMYGQAMNAGPSQLSQGLQQQGMDALSQGGNLSPAEIRQLQQSTREAYASRGTEMGSAAVTAEALAQSQAGRQRQMENVSLASGINQQLTAEQQANRAYQQSVQQQEIARQQGNVGVGLQAQLANQGVSAQQSLANQQAYNQFALSNQQAGLSTQEANRNFAAQQQQQGISNLGMLGQLQQGQGAADRAYALQMAGAYGSTSFDPMMAILGRQSSSPQMGAQQQSSASGMMGQFQGPQLFDPNAGINLALQNSSNLGNYNASTYGARAAATGAIIGGAMQGIGSAIGCWVAREVYGADNIRWMLFREWMLNDSPAWFRKLYIKHGEQFALWVANKPRIKNLIRKFMDGRIEAKFGTILNTA
jgi:hypothetical protein